MTSSLGHKSRRRWLLSLLLVLCAETCHAAIRPEQPMWHRVVLAERDRLDQEATQFAQRKAFRDAVASGERALALERLVFGNVHDEIADSIIELAGWHVDMHDYADGMRLWRELLSLRTKQYGEHDWRSRDAVIEIGHTTALATLSQAQREQLDRSAVLEAQAEMDRRRGALRAAVAAIEEKLDIDLRILGKDHPFYGKNLDLLGTFHYELEEHETALEFYKKAVESRREVLTESHPLYAMSVDNLGLAYWKTGQLELFEQHCREALRVMEKARGKESFGYARCLDHLGLLHIERWNFLEAERCYREQRQILHRVLDRDNAFWMTADSGYAHLCFQLGDYRQALELYDQIAADFRDRGWAESPYYRAIQLNQAAQHFQLGDYRTAVELTEEAVRGANRSGAVQATLLENLAVIYSELGDNPRAEEVYEKAYEIRRASGEGKSPAAARALINFATHLSERGSHDRASELLDQASTVLALRREQDSPDHAHLQSALAGLHMRTSNHDAALPALNRALFLRRSYYGEQHPQVAASLASLAHLHLVDADSPQAVELYSDAYSIEVTALGESNPQTASTLSKLARAHALAGNVAEAADLSLQAIAIAEKALQVTSTCQSERQQLAMQRAYSQFVDHCCEPLIAGHRDVDSVYGHLLPWKGMTTVRQRLYRVAATSPESKTAFSQLQNSSNRLAALWNNPPLPPRRPDARESSGYATRRKNWERDVQLLISDCEGLEARLADSSAVVRSSLSGTTVAELKENLPRNVALIDFRAINTMQGQPAPDGRLTYQTRYVAFIIEAGRPVRFVDLAPVREVHSQMQRWRADWADGENGVEAGLALRRLLWEPLEAHVQHLRNDGLVLLSPYGELGKLPFAALPGVSAETYLIEQYQLAHVSIPALLPRLMSHQGSSATGEMLLFGGIDYDNFDGDGEVQPALLADPAPNQRPPGLRDGQRRFSHSIRASTAREIAKIAESARRQVGQGVHELTGPRATEATFMELAPQYTRLHVATHAYFDDRRRPSSETMAVNNAATAAAGVEAGGNRAAPMEARVHAFSPGSLSGIALAGANQYSQRHSSDSTDRHDGILTAREIGYLPLEAVDLVVLSACETGLGKTAGGEGLLGLQRAFQVAGARTTVASLWNVPNHATSLLMQRFYRNIWERDMPTATALREAQLWILKNPGVVKRPDLADDEVRGFGPVGDADQAAPFYWAAWVISGDWR